MNLLVLLGRVVAISELVSSVFEALGFDSLASATAMVSVVVGLVLAFEVDQKILKLLRYLVVNSWSNVVFLFDVARAYTEYTIVAVHWINFSTSITEITIKVLMEACRSFRG